MKTILTVVISFVALLSTSSNAGVLDGVMGALISKAQELSGACHSTVVSGFRRGARVAGSGRPSLHASGHAIDVKGNPSCIYAHLHGWSGGYSTDYASVNHVHISLGGREDGLRFRHGGHSRHYAKHHHHRYAKNHRRYFAKG